MKPTGLVVEGDARETIPGRVDKMKGNLLDIIPTHAKAQSSGL
jgi:hypothetical protein